jgi:hypothetical protein
VSRSYFTGKKNGKELLRTAIVSGVDLSALIYKSCEPVR